MQYPLRDASDLFFSKNYKCSTVLFGVMSKNNTVKLEK